jgi:hypothetical protein
MLGIELLERSSCAHEAMAKPMGGSRGVTRPGETVRFNLLTLIKLKLLHGTREP